ncbi:MAG: hypothetical protein NTX48_00825 [Planctomycetales bacterium]|nr:hypothetical protein [Planctomycetales bacterium]
MLPVAFAAAGCATIVDTPELSVVEVPPKWAVYTAGRQASRQRLIFWDAVRSAQVNPVRILLICPYPSATSLAQAAFFVPTT